MRFFVDIRVKEEEDESWCASPSMALLHDIHERDQSVGSARWIAKIGTVYSALGDPVRGTTPWQKELFVPSWLLNQAGVEEGDRVSIEMQRSASLPEAEHLNLKVLGELPEGWDIRMTLEEPLSQLGVLHEGQILPCPMLEGVSLLVQICQPAGPVFLHGNEVSLEIEHQEPTRSEPPPPVVATTMDDFASMIPMESILPLIQEKKPSFQAFQGKGYSLR